MQPQMPLGLEVSSRLTADGILVGSANEQAMRWLEHWPNWPGPARALNIFGPSGSGKSTIARYFAEQENETIASATTASVTILGSLPVFCADIMRDKHIVLDGLAPTQNWNAEALFHLYNWVVAQKGSLLLLSNEPVARLPWQLDDLRSRLATAATQEIYVPDDVFLKDFLRQLFIQRQCSVATAILNYMVLRMPREYGFAIRLAEAVDKASLASQKPISIGLVKSVMTHLDAQQS